MNNEELKLCNEWAAAKCGIEVEEDECGDIGWKNIQRGEVHFDYWTMLDARCREIVREHFKIDTEYFDDKWWALEDRSGSMDNNSQGSGESIEAAEIACIKAIRLSDE